MPRRPPEEIIQVKTRMIERRTEKIKDLPEEIRSSYLNTMGMTATSIALNYLLLGSSEDSKKWFNKSVTYYFSSKQIKEKYKEKYRNNIELRNHFLEIDALHMLHSAILTEDIRRMNEISKDIIDNPPYRSLRSDLALDYVKSLAMLILNSPEFDPVQINKFKELEEKYAKKLSGASNGVAQSLLAIYNSENESLMEGINQIICQFFYRIKRLKEIPICVEAIMLLKLAETKGMRIDLDDIEQKYRKYIPGCMFEG